MGCDMVVALGQATIGGQRLFGLNWHAARAQWPLLRRCAGQTHAAGSVVKTQSVAVPQARQTCTVVGCGPRGQWGLTHGLNEHQLTMGMSTWTSKVVRAEPGLLGSDLVRLTLERSHSARHALEVLTDLIARHGQGQGTTPEGRDHIFLIADPREALVVEAAGSFWAAIECQQVRAVTDTAMIRQDWQRLAPGLAQHAIDQGWWRDDGSKLDFSGCLGAHPPSHARALKRWGRATLRLEQQNGNIDLWYLRRMLADHFEGAVRRPALENKEPAPTLVASFLTALDEVPEAIALAWCAFGPANQAVYFPLFLDGDLPALFAEDNIAFDGFVRLPAGLGKALRHREERDKLQARLDQQTEDFVVQARLLKKQNNMGQLQRQATLFMAQAVEAMESERPSSARGPAPAARDLAYFAE